MNNPSEVEQQSEGRNNHAENATITGTLNSSEQRLKGRILVVIAGFAISFAIMFFANEFLFDIIAAVLATVVAAELLTAFKVNSAPTLFRSSLLCVLLIAMGNLWKPAIWPNLSLCLAILVMLLAVLTVEPNFSNSNLVFSAIMGVSFALILGDYLILLRHLPSGRELILLVSIGTWGRDVAAFITGRFVPVGHPLNIAVSPHKNYEGALGGLLLCVVAVVISSALFLPGWSTIKVLFLGLCIGVMGQIGDLVESWLKRASGIRHSSRLLATQGGFLDSFDSFIYTVPVAYYYVVFVIYREVK